jgi:hypothetical protein
MVFQARRGVNTHTGERETGSEWRRRRRRRRRTCPYFEEEEEVEVEQDMSSY